MAMLRTIWERNRDELAAYLRRRRRRAFAPAERPPPDAVPELVRTRAPCAFVLSTGRCGTLWLTRALALHDRLVVDHDPVPSVQLGGRRLYEAGAEAPCGAEVAMACRYEHVRDAYLQGLIYVETHNRASFLAPWLGELFQGARFVHLVRDPAAFVVSGLRRGYYTGRPMDEGRIVPRAGGEAAAAWPSMGRAEKIAWLWNETNAWIEAATAGLDPERVRFVRAEALFSDPSVAAGLVRFCGEPEPREAAIAKLVGRPANVQRSGEAAATDAEVAAAVRRWAPLAAPYGYGAG